MHISQVTFVKKERVLSSLPMFSSDNRFTEYLRDIFGGIFR
jgi:hypothetical protein